MNTLKIEVLDPKAVKLLKDLADLKLISIKKNDENSFAGVLKELRSKAFSAPSLDEITKETELVRTKLNAR